MSSCHNESHMRARPFPFAGDVEVEVAADVLPETAAGSDLAGETGVCFDGESILPAGSAFTCRR